MGVLNRLCHDRHRPVWQVNPDIPDELSDLIDQLLEKKPTRRIASASNAKDALARLLSRVQERSGHRPGRAARFLRRHRTGVFVSCACVALAVIAERYWPTSPAHSINSQSDPYAAETLPSPVVELSKQDAQTLALGMTATPLELQELSHRIDGLNAALDESRFSQAKDDEFALDILRLDQTLDRLNDESFTTVPTLPRNGADP